MDKSSYRLLIVAYGASLLQILPFVKNLKKENSSVVIDLLTDLKTDSITDQIRDYVTKVYVIRKFSERFSHGRVALLFDKCLFIVPFLFFFFFQTVRCGEYSFCKTIFVEGNALDSQNDKKHCHNSMG